MITINTLQPRGIKVYAPCAHTHTKSSTLSQGMQLPVFGIQYSLGNLWVAGWWTAMISRGQTVRIPTHSRASTHTRTRIQTYTHTKQHNIIIL